MTNQCVVTVLIALQLEQRLASAAHIPLANSSQKTFITTYTALSLYEPKTLTHEYTNIFSGKAVAADDIFINYQIGSMFGHTQLSSKL
jgi:hypothetical protein